MKNEQCKMKNDGGESAATMSPPGIFHFSFLILHFALWRALRLTDGHSRAARH
jgi:hypothetical protein